MTKEELEQLNHLATKLRAERMKELVDENGDEIEEYADEEIYDMDDGDNCIQGCDIVIGITIKQLTLIYKDEK